MKCKIRELLFIALLLSLLAGCSAKTGTVHIETARIGAIADSIGYKYIEFNHPDAKLQKYDSISDCIEALQNGELDYVVTAYTTALYYIRINDGLEILPDRLTDEGAAIAVAKNDVELLSGISEVLDRFSSDGTLDGIISNWIKEDGSAYVKTDIPVKQNGEILIVGVSANREPMCFVEDGIYIGLDCELIERIAYELGMKVEYEDMPFSELIDAMEGGRVDAVISNLFPSEERKERVSFTVEYFKNPQVFITRFH